MGTGGPVPGQHQDVVVRVRTVEIDRATVEAFESEIELPDEPCRLVVDLHDVTFIDSSGVRALIVAHHRANEVGSSLVVCNLGASIQRVLDVLGARELLEGAPR